MFRGAIFDHLKPSKKFFLGVLAFSIILAVLASVFWLFDKQGITVVTTEQEYASGQDLKLEIKNSFFNKEFCFSSCYPYFLEREDGAWQSYFYAECLFADEISQCIKPKELRAFLVSLPPVEVGKHRISVPICEGCSFGQSFHETKRIFSNEFEISHLND